VAPTLNAFGPLTLSGQNQTTTATWAGTFKIIDASGTGNGWNVIAQSQAFSCAYNASTNPRCPSTGGDTFPNSELNGGAFSSASCGTYTEQGCGVAATKGALPTGDGASGGFIDTPNPSGGSQEFHAIPNTGMGTYDVTLYYLSLVVPADVYAATYTTTITYTLASGPGAA
jgi:hypothetical protein